MCQDNPRFLLTSLSSFLLGCVNIPFSLLSFSGNVLPDTHIQTLLNLTVSCIVHAHIHLLLNGYIFVSVYMTILIIGKGKQK